MIPFQGLLKKEFYVTRLSFLTWVIFMLIANIASFVIANRIDEPLVPIGFQIAIAVFHIGLMPIMLLTSLKLEGKTQLWLYNPQSSKTLLLSKITMLAAYQLISQLILVLTSQVAYKYAVSQGVQIEHFPISTVLAINISLLLIGLYASLWIMFYWCFFHSLGKYPSIKKVRWLFILILFFIFNAIETAIMQIDFLRDIVTKWKLPMYINPRFHYEVTSHKWNMQFDMQQVAIIPLIIYAVIAIALYIISSWLLDKKVEV
ncbi:hypothetical protein [Bacillus sp. FJAT-49736]|uniref:hypothetical protein n=1 Tax=Bacillus sp. FJAT-49736 TaxID=2833582 RepID=UPI001BC99941|nr:hypothetical protein [Bacillus sp. FJAT-49736]MBS4173654.1 hypothetical protein [Bacillus sp. FJAT-49736]